MDRRQQTWQRTEFDPGLVLLRVQRGCCHLRGVALPALAGLLSFDGGTAWSSNVIAGPLALVKLVKDRLRPTN
jgi:hypothetical protein